MNSPALNFLQRPKKPDFCPIICDEENPEDPEVKSIGDSIQRDIDEFKEIKGNNIAVSIFLSVIIIAIALLLEPGLRTLLDALIPFPPVSFIDIGG